MSDYGYEPECPYCGVKQTDLGELGLSGDGDSAGTDCISCGKEIVITASVSINYWAEKPTRPEHIRRVESTGIVEFIRNTNEESDLTLSL